MAMLENLCLDKRKNKSAKLSENLSVLSIDSVSHETVRSVLKKRVEALAG
jgi:hypothetical protein